MKDDVVRDWCLTFSVHYPKVASTMGPNQSRPKATYARLTRGVDLALKREVGVEKDQPAYGQSILPVETFILLEQRTHRSRCV